MHWFSSAPLGSSTYGVAGVGPPEYTKPICLGLAKGTFTVPEKEILKQLIATLKRAIAEDRLTDTVVEQATDDLSAIRQYDTEKFPKLTNTGTFSDSSGNTPNGLAEALLWKLGKWKVYKKFAANYSSANPSLTKTDVVLFAFTKHLKDSAVPIYDQHTIRSLWAICGKLSPDEARSCRSLLFDGKNKWKATGSGGETIECYELFVSHMNSLTANRIDAPTMERLDRLMMPLGQAIKRSTSSYKEFCELCGLPGEA